MAQAGAVVTVGSELRFAVETPCTFALQVAVARTDRLLEERLDLTGDVGPTTEVLEAHGGVTHVVDCEPGPFVVRYRADVRVDPPEPQPVSALDRLVYQRQSRYCPSDRLGAFATAELGGAPPAEIGAWVFERVDYVPGSSGPSDGAVDTMLAGAGVCRDFAHLTIALCRALDVPARLVAVYAPGLSPMDFHAVAEVAGDDGWEVVDATRLAPRSSLVRISTGRDAADTAFASVARGRAELEHTEVTAVIEGDLPADDHRARAVLR